MPTVQYFGPSYTTPISTLQNYFDSILPAFFNSFLTVLAALVVFLIGWLIAFLIKVFIEYVLEKINFSDVFKSVGLDKYFENFSWEERFDKVLAEIVFWVVLFIFLMTSFDILGLQTVNLFLKEIVNYIPKVVAGGLVLLLGFILGEILRKFLLGILHGLEKKSARGVASFMKWVVIVFAFIIALNQWGIAPEIMETLVMGLVVFLALAGGLAFGLGGQDLAREILESWKEKFK